MPQSTDLNVSPYFDDYDETKDYYKILFRPGVSVQVREMNQLQTMLQKQVERFGDNIFKRGTIIDGCDITFHSVFPYVKLTDTQTDGAPVNVLSYTGYNVRNQANVSPLIGKVVTATAGFESRSPDLNTLYVRYINSGYSNVGGVLTEESTFSANQVLTVYDPANIIEKVNISDPSGGFANTDNIIFTSALAIQNSSGGTAFANNYYVGDYITNSSANAQIIEVDTTSNTEVVILRIKPRAADLKAANSALWTFSTNTNIQSLNASPSSIATVVSHVGSGAAATLKTGSLGEIDLVSITSKGSGYYVLPTVSVSSPGATLGQISSANLVSQNYLTNITVANNAMLSIGSGYAMTVGQGVIYQKGFFSRVNEHMVVVEKYANTPDAISVGFDTQETIVSASQDTSLYDNATGEPNLTAPGANRLQLTPKLVVLTKAQADANTDFLPVAEFAAGKPYKQNRQTVYNIIGNEMARRTYEESGNYVLDTFVLNTKSTNTFADEEDSFNIVIDPGKAYINGNRVETTTNYEASVAKGTDTVVVDNGIISLNYGNFVRVKELGGLFLFKTGDLVDLYGVAAEHISDTAGSTPSAAGLGTKLGTARIRSLTHDSGIAGTASAVFNLYLFDIQMSTGKNFADVKSIFYNGANKGVCDTVLEAGRAVLRDNAKSSMVYYAGRPAVKQANNLSYVYRTVANNLTLASNGIISWATTGGETFPYTGVLSSTQEKDLIIVPLANTELAANIAGGVSCNTSSTQVNGSSTTFVADVNAGDFIKIANSSASVVAQVNNIVNNTVLHVTGNPTSAISGNAVLYFPKGVPISLDRSTRSANVNPTADIFYVNLGASMNVATDVAVAYNVRSSNTTPVSKTVNRDHYVRLNIANNSTGTNGPWVLGVPDAFRLKGVYLGSNTSFLETDSGVDEVTNSFYVDHNQAEDYYGLSYLYKKPNDSLVVGGSDVLLVKFDYFTDSAEGLKAPGDSGTYNIDDTKTLATSTSSINTMEIPELYGARGDYYDLRDHFDFRPKSSNTVTTSANAALAPINPVEASSATRFSVLDKKFPAPDSSLTGTFEHYQGRVSRVTVDENGEFHVIDGIPGTGVAPVAPTDALTINILNIPAYPSVPFQMSPEMIEFIDTKVANEKYTAQRLSSYRVSLLQDSSKRVYTQPRGYTMTDIGSLERRISNLEYYTAFNLKESQTQQKVIPSSSDPSVDRFKFGFFVDSFSTYDYSDVRNPGYRASVIDGMLVPHAEEINLRLESSDGNPVCLPFNEYTLISQPYATTATSTGGGTDSVTGTITILPDDQPTSNVRTQSITSVQQKEKSLAVSDSGNVYEEFFYTFSETAGPAEFYINGRDNYLAVEIFQSTTQGTGWVSRYTSATATPITSGDITSKGLSTLNDGRKIEHPGSEERKGFGPVGNWVEDHFKILWTHNPANGLYYKVRVYKGQNHGAHGKSGTYGFKLFYPIDVEVNATATIGTTQYNFGFDGNLAWSNSIIPIFSWNNPIGFNTYDLTTADPSLQPGTPSNYIMAEQMIRMQLTGLKPKTRHTPSINGVDATALIKQEGKLLGEGIVTDENGTAIIRLYYGKVDESASSVAKAALAILQSASAKNFKVTSADGTSTASNVLQIPTYVKETINNPPATTTSGVRANNDGLYPDLFGTNFVTRERVDYR